MTDRVLVFRSTVVAFDGVVADDDGEDGDDDDDEDVYRGRPHRR